LAPAFVDVVNCFAGELHRQHLRINGGLNCLSAPEQWLFQFIIGMQYAEKLVEPAHLGQVFCLIPLMPLADQRSGISERFQLLGQGDFLRSQPPGVIDRQRSIGKAGAN